MTELQDIWVSRDGNMCAEGDAKTIDDLLAQSLRVRRSGDGWTSLYRHHATGEFWELSYPQAEMHGGGPRRLVKVPILTAEDWCPEQPDASSRTLGS